MLVRRVFSQTFGARVSVSSTQDRDNDWIYHSPVLKPRTTNILILLVNLQLDIL